ncbi:GNAT family N-acetyltransferase/peptidase C39 family protein [Hahella ganghwensis]|uniref:GNAT family N-acetyltransferase/peptidase C39 family protein n=1 Tax=Hahella ganghwensis TaxID=286420 RepID=UPI000367599B|nr:GNAT family N-acetyltransferase/peptidase C39 family protein [Hahella ganghwensis]
MSNNPTPTALNSSPLFRRANINDLAALIDLENRCFQTDRLSRRNFKHMLKAESAVLHIAEIDNKLAAYIITLFHRGTSLARLYSIAVDPNFRGYGLARKLIELSEQTAIERRCIFMRLEVRTDNQDAIRLYEKLGYQQFGIYHDYYEDHLDALRFQKQIKRFAPPEPSLRVAYFEQTTDFTCGPASLMMTMATLNSDFLPNATEELQIWREATTIYMTSGHGGCGPHGLALAAQMRGFSAEVYVSQAGPLFTEGVRIQEKKNVLRLVHESFVEKLEQQKIPIHYTAITQNDIELALSQHKLALVMISTYHFDRKKAPHWVAVTAIDEDFVYIHDPDVDRDSHQRPIDNQYIPISRAQFDRMSQFGQNRLRTAVIIGRDSHCKESSKPQDLIEETHQQDTHQ